MIETETGCYQIPLDMIDEALRDEIREAAERLVLPASRFHILPDEEASEVWREVEAHFVREPYGGWWWACFQPKAASAHYIGEATLGYRYIAEVVPSRSEPLWFIAGDDCMSHSFVVCEGLIEDIRDVIGQCYCFEYYLVPKDMAWLLCENHHDYLIAVGDAPRVRLMEVASRNPMVFELD